MLFCLFILHFISPSLFPLSVVSKVSKQLMLLEAEKQRLQEELDESRGEVQRHARDVQVLQARLKDAITWDEHCNTAGKLRRYCYSVSFYELFLSLKDE